MVGGNGIPSCGHFLAYGLLITCVDTGVTLSSVCAPVWFGHTSLGVKTYTVAGAAAGDCDNKGHTYSSGFGTGTGQMPGLVLLVGCTTP